MRRSQRLIAAAALLALSGALGGCSSGFGGWDPTDLLDFLDTKKKLPGERKPVFPDGVPGLEQGVPKDLYKGAQEQPQQADPAAAAPVPEQPKSKRAAKSTGKKQPATAAGTAADPQPAAADAEATPEEEAPPATPASAPKPKKVARKRTTAPPPEQPAEPDRASQSAQSTQQQSAPPFPAPLPSGNFTR
jgi:hypothetical protein